jgi:hypothetical protein
MQSTKLLNFHAVSLHLTHNCFFFSSSLSPMSVRLLHSLNVRIVLLIRDPRGFLQSRKHRVWCPGNPDCDNPTLACKDMVSDYKAAIVLAKKFPMTFK